MRKGIFVCISIVLALFAVGCASTDRVATVSVSGSAELSIVPDVAFFSISAEAVEATSEAARIKTSSMVNDAYSVLTKKFGISEKDISTSYISIYPNYEYIDGKRELSGQRATQTISVTLRNIEKYGDIFSALTKIDGLSVSSANLDKLDKSDEIASVRALAIEAAFEKAKAYAEASGMEIDSVISISDGSSPSYSNYPVMQMKSASYDEAAVATEFHVGNISIYDNVSVVYSLK